MNSHKEPVGTRTYLRWAYQVAWNASDDPSTKNGAVLVPPQCGLYVVGVNHLPEGVKRTPERLQNPLKAKYMVHAEQDVIILAARGGVSTRGATLYCPWAACTRCAQDIIQAGIVRVVTHKQVHDKTPDRWKEDIDIAIAMLREAGITYEMFDGEIGECKGFFNGEEWAP